MIVHLPLLLRVCFPHFLSALSKRQSPYRLLARTLSLNSEGYRENASLLNGRLHSAKTSRHMRIFSVAGPLILIFPFDRRNEAKGLPSPPSTLAHRRAPRPLADSVLLKILGKLLIFFPEIPRNPRRSPNALSLTLWPSVFMRAVAPRKLSIFLSP